MDTETAEKTESDQIQDMIKLVSLLCLPQEQDEGTLDEQTKAADRKLKFILSILKKIKEESSQTTDTN
jgi:hypothetical protein